MCITLILFQHLSLENVVYIYIYIYTQSSFDLSTKSSGPHGTADSNTCHTNYISVAWSECKIIYKKNEVCNAFEGQITPECAYLFLV